MPTLKIDNQCVESPAGATILDAATQLGIEIPTLCFLRGYEPSTSCLVCIVKNRVTGQFVPACATKVADGMELDSETEEVHAMRRMALELLLSDHVGDCLAPCFFACPAHMDIPLMLQQIGQQELREAIATIKRDIALPSVLGRVCPKPCEKGCRRGAADGPVAVCELKRFVADADLASEDPYMPACPPGTGRRVAIVGAGPTGLAAAYYLRQQGHTCVLIEARSQPGGRLREEPELPPAVLAAEIAQVLRLGIELRLDAPLRDRADLDHLLRDFDAVLLACGAVSEEQICAWELTPGKRGVECDRETYQTERPGLFAAGNVIRGKGLVVRSVADGKEAARGIGQFLAGKPVRAVERPFSSRMARVSPAEMSQFVAGSGTTARAEPAAEHEFTCSQAADQSHRCLACGCAGHGHCQLEHYAAQYGADWSRFGTVRRPYEVIGRHGAVLFEPGKCIKCELCVKIAAAAREPLGLTFVGRGFDIRLAVPFDRSLDEGLQRVAAECVAACPTAALRFSGDLARSWRATP